jgi:hypothetical protein
MSGTILFTLISLLHGHKRREVFDVALKLQAT